MKKMLAAALLALAAVSSLPAAGPEDYEMATYQVGFYRKGPNWTAADSPEKEQIQKGHMAHIQKMADTGKLILAGPFADDGDLRGMLVFRVDTPEEARAIAEQDPAVLAGRLRLEWHPWFAARNITVTPKAPAPATPK